MHRSETPTSDKHSPKIRVPSDVVELCKTLRNAGFRGWAVGGCTRDSLLGRPVQDWDLATNAHPKDVARVFRRVIPTGIEHGTVTVLIGRKGYEVTTLRGEGTYSDGRHPDQVQFVDDLTLDLARRDFTINAIAYDPIDGTWTDPFRGRDDLQKRLIRAVGIAADRFDEDGLRVLRAARFVTTLGFDLEASTRSGMISAADRLRCVSQERVREELVKTLMAPKPSRGLEVMMQVGIIERVMPELVAMRGCEQNRYHAFDVWKHTLAAVDAGPKRGVMPIALLLHDVGKPEVRGINEKTGEYTFFGHEMVGARMANKLMNRLRFSNDERANVVHLVRYHVIAYDEQWSDSAVRRWVHRVGEGNVQDLLCIARADAMAKGHDPSLTLAQIDQLHERVVALREAGMAVTVRDLALNGRVIMQRLQLSPGPLIGDILEHLLQVVLDNPSRNQLEPLLEEARNYLETLNAHGAGE